jgi:DNA-binding NtrC family response regulator
MSNKTTIVYLDDEEHNLRSFKANLRREYNVLTTTSIDEAFKFMEHENLKVVVSDQRMPKMTGVEFFRKIKSSHPYPIRILLTGYSDIEAVVAAINEGEVYRYISKPWDTNSMRTTLKQAIEIFDLRKENERLVEELKRANSQLEFYLRQKLLS